MENFSTKFSVLVTLMSSGITDAQRRWYLATWVSDARKHLLEHQPGEIWKRHQQVGFVNACDGSEDHKIHFRDGNKFNDLHDKLRKSLLNFIRGCLFLIHVR